MIKKAVKIAREGLRRNYKTHGIYAGQKHFDEYWARDSFFASLGSLELKDYNIVKTNLNLFLKNQSKNGLIPVRIGVDRFTQIMKFFGARTQKRKVPFYNQDKKNGCSYDNNSLLIITFLEYIKKTNDIEFLKENIIKLEKAIYWNFSQDFDKDFLLEESKYGTWQDNVKKKGNVLYTNVLHCHALKCLSELFEILKDHQNKTVYNRCYENTKERIIDCFWNKTYLIDWIDEKKRKYFSTDGNLLAIIFNIVDKEKGKLIQNEILKRKICEGVPCLTNHPKYPFFTSTHFGLMITGMHDYQNGQRWLWQGCLDVIAKEKLGMKKEAQAELETISKIIVKNKKVFEVYNNKGEPINRLFYKSEYDFAWACGLFILAQSKFLKT
jgi:glycogen debranching enzyme